MDNRSYGFIAIVMGLLMGVVFMLVALNQSERRVLELVSENEKLRLSLEAAHTNLQTQMEINEQVLMIVDLTSK
jgi:uncharacterized membrane-anchored protein YhcB (DUF1043 family)